MRFQWGLRRFCCAFRRNSAKCANQKDHRSSAELIINQYAQAQIQKRKLETNDLTRFSNLPTSSSRREKILFKPMELKKLHIDPEIQIENLRKLAVEFSQTDQSWTLNKTDSKQIPMRVQNHLYIVTRENQSKKIKLNTKSASKQKLEPNSKSPESLPGRLTPYAIDRAVDR